MMPVIGFLPPKSADGPPGVFSDNGGKKGSFSGAASSANEAAESSRANIIYMKANRMASTRISRFPLRPLRAVPACPAVEFGLSLRAWFMFLLLQIRHRLDMGCADRGGVRAGLEPDLADVHEL